eukprot:Protomagalhaensia_sp_Gyna_25__791@NODE_1380_length_1894_cov_2_825876_g1110_i0_p1_GENE_NODE_1380_length_1894_cov_2_825876_g1110_i0NODE_1380_length_1894_cov_2_825876_g1110_i0_p1_ORF_typecomplete_len496_score79_68Mating_C/PF12737_7/0_06_NODE_1380_length_1894_cov_2_825876_g1110_i01491489
MDADGLEVLNRALDKSVPLNQVLHPSHSLRDIDSDRRFIDQWGASKPFVPPTTTSTQTGHSVRRLESCHELPNLIARGISMMADWFSGAMEPGEFPGDLRALLDEFVVAVDGKAAGLSRSTLGRARAISTESFALVPACSLPSSQRLPPPDVIRLGEILLRELDRVRVAVDKCGDCFEQLWIQVVAGALDGEVNEASAVEEARQMQDLFVQFANRLEAAVSTMTPETAPASIGEAVERLIEIANEAAEAAGTNIAALLEAALLFMDAIQKEAMDGGPTPIEDSLRELTERYLECPSTSQGKKRSLQVESEGSAMRDLQPLKRNRTFPIPYAAVGRASYQEPQARQIAAQDIPPVAGAGNLIPREALTGYQCRDSMPSIFSDYFSLWIEKADCDDLIDTFGCLSQRGQCSAILSFDSFLSSHMANEMPASSIARHFHDCDQADRRRQ